MTKEWLKRTSSRFWRGPMAQRFWVCTDKTLGHWRPKAADETEKAKKGSKRRKGSAGRQPKARRASGGHGKAHTSRHVLCQAHPHIACFEQRTRQWMYSGETM